MRAGSNWRHLNGLSLGMMGDPIRCLPKVVHPDVAALKLQHNLNSRYGRTLIGYGQCGEPGGYVGAKIAYGRIPELEDFH